MLNIQAGYACEVKVTSPSTIEKTSLKVYSEADARRIADDLVTYEAQLQASPVTTVPLHEADIVEGNGGYRVRHTTELIDAPSLAELIGDERILATRHTIGQIAEMATFKDGATLVTPIDAFPPNFHGGVLIDLYPPLPRRANGRMPLENIPSRATRVRAERDYGQRTGAIVQLLATSVTHVPGRLGKLGHALRQADDWCYDALPDNLLGRDRDEVRRAIAMRFLPFIIRKGVTARVSRLAGSE